ELFRSERKASGGGEREEIAGCAERFPGGGMAAGLEGFQGSRAGEMKGFGPAQRGPPDDILDGGEGTCLAGVAEAFAGSLAHTTDMAPADADRRRLRIVGRLERTLPVPACEAGRPHVHARSTGIVDEGGGSVEAHWPGIEE